VIGSVRVEGLVLGLCLVALGVVWTLSNLGRLDLLTTLRTWWPASLVVWGALELAAALNRRAQDGRS
jgi:cell wall-active antibiotic response 4TMS protein YvqF